MKSLFASVIVLLLAACTDRAEEQAALGRLLFFDTSLSEPAGQSCATCHDPARAFTDPDMRRPTSKGVHPERFGSRNTPSALYMAFSPPFHFDPKEGHYVGGQFWDGRAATLEEQAMQPLLNPLEMANPDKRTVVEKVRNAPYAPMFKRLYGQHALDEVEQGYARIAHAIATFERSVEMRPFNSRYDAWLAGQAQLTDQEMRGLKLYEDEKKGNCAACHPSQRGPNGEPPLFTDFTYDNLGVPRNPEHPQGAAFVDKGLGGVVKKAAEDGKFKVPTLRNIARTAPYMHNGYFKTLRSAVAFYNNRDTLARCAGHASEAEALKRNCWPAPEVAANVNTEELGDLKLSEQEVDDITAFLNTLNDGWRP